MPNEAAKRVIEEYLSRSDPGYALLVDAPWGSGKTYIVKKVTNVDADATRLYVTLYDVHSPEAFDWALVRAINPWSEEASASWGARAKELASNVRLFGCSVDLTKINLTEIALRSLPETLIFDDVERCGLSHAQLSGLINRFVEHQKKRVILIANSDEHKDKASFDASREKVIGQTITLRPEPEPAIAASWVQIASGQGCEALKARQSLVIKTFEEAEHQNLRLLLRSMRDAAAMLDVLTAPMLEQCQAVDHLTATFIALHMAYHGGQLSKLDMQNRARINTRYMTTQKNEKEGPPDALEWLQERHPNCNIEVVYNDVLPVDLGYSLIVEGYAAPDYTRTTLLETHQFTSPSEQPDWVRLWKWYELPWADLEAILHRVEQMRARSEITEPGEILQIYGAEQLIAKNHDTLEAREVARKWYDYIGQLASAGRIRPSIPASVSAKKYGFDWSYDTIGFGGRAFEADRRARFLAGRLQAEMDSVFEKEIHNTCQRLLNEFRDQPAEFIQYFQSGDTKENFSRTPILHRLPSDQFASVLLKLRNEQLDTARLVASTLAQRRTPQRTEFELEHAWFDDLEREMLEQAKADSEMHAAVIRAFIKRDLERK